MTTTVPVDRIVVGVDGSPSSEDALRWALGLANLTGATVDAVTAWQMQPVYGWALVVPDEASEDLARRIQEASLGEVLPDARPGVAVRRHVTQGPPAQVLTEAAEGADLLVVGTRGHNTFVEALLGSVGQQCAHRAPCPVVIVHGRDAKGPDGEGADTNGSREDEDA